MMRPDQTRTYDRDDSVVFLKTDEPFGGLSNMAGGFPLCVNGIRILTSEALYQACRFPHRPEVQTLIIEQRSPMTAKMKSKPYRHDSRPDWDRVRVKIMRWCLRVKLAQNWRTFSALLLETGTRSIVEESRKDDFWGAKAIDEQILVGVNVLGRLLMELREAIKTEEQDSLLRVKPLSISDFLLDGRPVGIVVGEDAESVSGRVESAARSVRGATSGGAVTQPSLFDRLAGQTLPPPARMGTSSTGVRIADLKPYAEYKESGLPWLGQVPGHWEIKRGKSYLTAIDERSKYGREELLTVSSTYGVIPRRTANVTMFKAESYAGHKLCWPGDLVINSLWAWAGGLGVSRHHGIVSTAYSVYRSRPSAQIDPRYLHQLVRSAAFHWELQVRSKGVWISRLQLTDTAFLDAPILLPPLPEQAAIVRFLDWANGRLERAIRAKRKVIALLGEQKQAIIHRAVTRGLDPSVPLKPSGIPWLGDIPQHWDLSPNRAFLRIRKVLVGERHPQFQLLSLTKRGVIIRDLSKMRGKFSSDMGTSQEVRSDDLVFCLFDVPETPRTVGLSKHDGMITGAYTVMECSDPQMAKFLELFYIAMDDRKLLSPIYSGLRNTIPKDRFLGAKTPIPPAPERAAILAVITRDTSALNHSISRLEHEIDLLREYRTRLVADVVTGKFDVREVVAHLPDEAPLDTVEDDTDLGDEADAADEEAAA